MQSKRIVILFIVITLIPVLALFSNHEIFFWLLSAILLALSIRSIFRLITGESLQNNESDDEIEEELEELIDIDVKKMEAGISVMTSLIIILFLFYCAFYLEAFILKVIVAFTIMLQIYFIIKKTGKATKAYSPDRYKPQILLASILNITIILFSVLNKLYKMR